MGTLGPEREVSRTRLGLPTAPRSPAEPYLLGVSLCDGRAAVGCPGGRACGLRGTLTLPAGGSCSSDPRWPWPTKGTTASCAGSPRGPGAGKSPSDAQARPLGSVRSLHPEEPPSGSWGRPRNPARAPALPLAFSCCGRSGSRFVTGHHPSRPISRACVSGSPHASPAARGWTMLLGAVLPQEVCSRLPGRP